MKNIAFLILLLVGLSLGTNAYADIAVEGEQDVQIELLNADAFPQYTFFIRYQTYYYSYGYQEGPVDIVDLEQGKHYVTGEKGSGSLLYAKFKDEKQQKKQKHLLAQSKEMVGGSDIDSDPEVRYILDRIEITKVQNGEVHFVVKERQRIGEGGKVLSTLEKGMVSDTGWAIWLLPILSLGGLLAFFLLRRSGAKA